MKKQDQIAELLTRGVAEVVVKENLEKKLQSGKKLRIKFGIDPTGDCIHLGHSVALLKLREFQELGHTVIFLIGDHTATIGDPSGRSKERPRLSEEQIKKNMSSYVEQAGRILDIKRVEVRHNSEWYSGLGIMEFAELASQASIAQIMQRADFKKRMAEGSDISMLEVFYPILQGYDSVKLDADVEIGGTDQKFNLLMGRQIQKRYGKEEQDVLMVPLLEGTDGVAKMSKTSGNFIGITEDPDSMYGKIMSVPDSLIIRYFELTTRVPMSEVSEIESELKGATVNPRDIKMMLARELVTLYHGEKYAKEAERTFVTVFQKKEVPDEIPEIKVQKKEWNIVDLLVESKLATSKGEARRLVEQGGIMIRWADMKHGDAIIDDPKSIISIKDIEEGFILRRGKRHFVKITL